jgi:SanA protein
MWTTLLLIGIGIVLTILAYTLIEWYASAWVFDDVEKVPKNRVALVLGTSRRMADGRVNLYFKYRINAAVELYKAKKVDYLLVSGDNSLSYYNEPMDMKKALMEAGIPENVIFLDYAGFRTLDSVVRANKVFGQSRYTVVSQPFHNKRAIFIARQYGIQAIGYNAKDVNAEIGFKTQVREIFARVNVFLDLYLLFTKPKFLGESVKIY